MKTCEGSIAKLGPLISPPAHPHSIWNQISTGVVSEMSLQRAREVFLNASTIRSSWAG